MGLQLIFVVETDLKCKSDWIYIKDTIEQFYQYNRTQVKFTPVYMAGKGKYIKKEKEISKLTSQYSAASKTNQSRVIYCFDCDDYDSKPEDSKFLESARRYCNDRKADFVWFCKDIEQVYLGKRIDKSKKKNEAAHFKAQKGILHIRAEQLIHTKYKPGASNIMEILNQYLDQKQSGPETICGIR